MVDFKTEVTYDIGSLRFLAKTWIISRETALALLDSLTLNGKCSNFWLDIQGGSKVCEEAGRLRLQVEDEFETIASLPAPARSMWRRTCRKVGSSDEWTFHSVVRPVHESTSSCHAVTELRSPAKHGRRHHLFREVDEFVHLREVHSLNLVDFVEEVSKDQGQ